jgi:hypothetical protein
MRIAIAYRQLTWAVALLAAHATAAVASTAAAAAAGAGRPSQTRCSGVLPPGAVL